MSYRYTPPRGSSRALLGPAPAGRTRTSRAVGALSAAALSAAALLAAACGGKDPYAPTARRTTVATTVVLYPVSRVQAPFYSALDLFTPTPVRPAVVAVPVSNSSVALAPNFDVAFDVDASGKILLLQPKQLVSAQLVPRTGFQTSTTPFDSLGTAPGGNYQSDSTVSVSVGQTVAVETQGLTCQNASPFYAKLVVDRYDAPTGALTIRLFIDPNCGFRSFATGLPES